MYYHTDEHLGYFQFFSSSLDDVLMTPGAGIAELFGQRPSSFPRYQPMAFKNGWAINTPEGCSELETMENSNFLLDAGKYPW